MRTALIVCALAVVVCWAVASPAQVPATTSYQGVLKDDLGDNVADGDYDFTFSLYDVPSGGSALWTEAQTLSVTDGIFNATLGAVAPLDLSFDVPYWLGVAVDPDAEMDPRHALMTAPYAFRAAVADSVVGGGGSDTDWVEAGGNVYRLTGKVGIGTSTPEFALTLAGDGGIIAEGTFGSGDTLTTTGVGARLVWYPRKAAFRVGRVNGDQWDDANIGTTSVGLGFNTVADDVSSIAIGHYASSTGAYGVAIGFYADVTGHWGVGIGSYTSAALRGTAIGYRAATTADGGIAIGYDVRSSGVKSVVIGTGVDESNPLVNNTSNSLVMGFNSTDALLFAGGPDSRVGIGTTTPGELLDVAGTVEADGLKMPTGAVDGYVLTSDAAGVGTWQAAPGGGGGLTLPYSGSSGEPGTIFSVGTSDSGPAIEGLQFGLGSAKVGRLGSTVAGVTGIDLYSGNSGQLGTSTHAGYFEGDVAIDVTDAAVRVEGDTTYAIYAHYTGADRNGVGVYGQTDVGGGGAAGGYFVGWDTGVSARTDPSAAYAYGVYSTAGGASIGTSAEGVAGYAICGEYGTAIGVHGHANASGPDVIAAWGIYGEAWCEGGDCLAGKFDGDVDVTESLSVGGFRMNEAPVDGYVLTTDESGYGTWQAPSTGTIGGSGIAGSIPVFTDATTLGSSVMSQSGDTLFVAGNSEIGGNVAVAGTLSVDTSLIVDGHDRTVARFASDAEISEGNVVEVRYTGDVDYGNVTGMYVDCAHGAGDQRGRAAIFRGGLQGVWADAIGELGGSTGVVANAWSSGGDATGVFCTAEAPNGVAVAGQFIGNVNVVGTLTKGAGSFKIDHPLDPENKYLSHSFVESPDMMNIYNGNVVLERCRRGCRGAAGLVRGAQHGLPVSAHLRGAVRPGLRRGQDPGESVQDRRRGAGNGDLVAGDRRAAGCVRQGSPDPGRGRQASGRCWQVQTSGALRESQDGGNRLPRAAERPGFRR